MKILSLVVIALIFNFTLLKAEPIDSPQSDQEIVNSIASKYINAVWHGKLTGLSEVFDDNVKFYYQINKRKVAFNKSEILDYLKDIKNVEQNCDVDYSVKESFPGQYCLIVDMKYELFIKKSYITIAETEEGWKIINVSNIFE